MRDNEELLTIPEQLYSCETCQCYSSPKASPEKEDTYRTLKKYYRSKN